LKVNDRQLERGRLTDLQLLQILRDQRRLGQCRPGTIDTVLAAIAHFRRRNLNLCARIYLTLVENRRINQISGA
jgi:hypothetical protein